MKNAPFSLKESQVIILGTNGIQKTQRKERKYFMLLITISKLCVLKTCMKEANEDLYLLLRNLIDSNKHLLPNSFLTGNMYLKLTCWN